MEVAHKSAIHPATLVNNEAQGKLTGSVGAEFISRLSSHVARACACILYPVGA